MAVDAAGGLVIRSAHAPLPPIPPGGMLGAPLGSGQSAAIAAVVINNPAIEAAPCSATRTTLVGSIIPATTMSL